MQSAVKNDGATEVTPVPDILINKYNRFVDGIFGRINKILARSYDPVNVRLTATETTKTKAKKTAVAGNKKRYVCFFFFLALRCGPSLHFFADHPKLNYPTIGPL